VAEDLHEDFGAFSTARGSVLVTTQVPMFKKIRYYTGENVGAGEIRLPAEQMGTCACWIDVGADLAGEMRIMEGGRSQALRGVAALLRAVAPVFLRCDRGDLRVHAEARSAATDLPRIVAYDRVPGGVGLAEGVHTALRPIVRAMREIVENCKCAKGCPGCVGSGGDVGPYGKEIAKHLLAALVRAVDCSARPGAPRPRAADRDGRNGLNGYDFHHGGTESRRRLRLSGCHRMSRSLENQMSSTTRQSAACPQSAAASVTPCLRGECRFVGPCPS